MFESVEICSRPTPLTPGSDSGFSGKCLQHFLKLRLIDNPDPELSRLIQLGARLRASQYVIGFLADAAGDVTAERFNFFCRFLACH